MALLKKTIVLSDKKVKGYVTVVHVGEEIGIKIVGDDFRPDFSCCVKIGETKRLFPLSGERTELTFVSSMHPTDELGCIVFIGNKVVAKGGKDVSLYEATRELSQKSDPPEPKENAEQTDEKERIFENLSKSTTDFYLTVKEKVDELFVIHPAEKTLSALIPDSEWVKIRYDREDYYVVGRLYENGKIRFLGYGVPGKKSLGLPKIAEGVASWLDAPLSGSDLNGYWLFFQNADTGKIET